jgi:glyoxylase-like metal-dependent hydrolase (beta-lactamase superfamily II)
MKFGQFEIELLDAGHFHMDGGMMFGVVPKVLWEKKKPADELNRIHMCTNSLLIRAYNLNILVEAGIGNKYSPKERERWKISEEDALGKSLAEIGMSRNDIDIVIQTHLHFDHAGGMTIVDDRGYVVPAFPKAKYLVQRKEWEFALSPDPRSKASFIEDNFIPVYEKNLVEFVDGNAEILPGIELRLTGAHTPGHQSVFLKSQDLGAVFLGDVIPFPAHLRTPWVAATDLFPLDSMEQKLKLREEAANNRYLVIFVHETDHPSGHLDPANTEELIPFEMPRTINAQHENK